MIRAVPVVKTVIPLSAFLLLCFILLTGSFPLLAQPAQPLNSWAMGAPMPTARWVSFSGVIGRKIYVVGGESPAALFNVNEVYDTVTNSWTTAVPMPTARTTGASAVVNNILYTMGGSTASGPSNVVEAYDPSTDSWSTKAPMPVRLNSLYGTVQNGIIYVIGGFDGNNRVSTSISYNPSTNSWTTLAPMRAGKSGAALGVFGSMIVAAGGLSTDSTNSTTDNETYNIATNTWTSLAPLPTARQGACFEVGGGLLYIAGGDRASVNALLTSTDAYNPATNSWTTGLPAIPVAVGGPASASVGGRLYCFGGSSTGQNGSNATVYNHVQIYQPPVQAPAISSGGVVSASAFGGFSSAAPGSWVEIYGSNLAGDSRSWTQSDFSGSSAPTVLDGTTVSIGGQAAYIDYISSGQVNAQVPSNVAPGNQHVIVTTPGGASATYPITINAAQPGLLAPSSFTVGGTQYVVALFPDAVTYVLPPASIAGVSSQRASPGQTITLYGVGFGPVTPAIPAGQITGQSNALAGTIQISIGGAPATMAYAGLAPGYVGLYQFNVVVPNIPSGNSVPVTFSLNGVAGAQTLFTAVGN